MKRLSKEHTIKFFSAINEPKYRVELGETVIVETYDCYAGQIVTENDLRPQIDITKVNLATGPIYIEAVKSGDTLCIDVIDIQTADYGFMVASPGIGILGSDIAAPSTRILEIKNGQVKFNESIAVPFAPMIGVIGVAPSNGEIQTAVPGSHGGNLDTKDVKPGNKIYLPVSVDGALVALGDLHAAMGDGELSGTGVETSGEVKLKFSKFKSRLQNPVVEDSEAFYFLASASTYEEAVDTALRDAVSCLQQQSGLSFEDCHRLLSLACDLKISQIVNKLLTVRVRVPKTILVGVTTI
ncbi:amidase [Planomicrobium soli]|uniref:Amidase n=1 Tax=Planomicrobium soli TaxID=1176648 RepID=A0A2P8H559_9BACL|nr:acetamidase/formamidase family protein [Planomicrobium soli]PSL41330.1 amidase [Planomicrobium soli]